MATIALIAHDGRQDDLVELFGAHAVTLTGARLVATETAGRLLEQRYGLYVELVLSGPFGGDLQIGARVANGEFSLVIFLRDPLTAHAHDPDIQALMKVCDVHRVPLATNAGTADLCLQALAWRRRRPARHTLQIAVDGDADDEA